MLCCWRHSFSEQCILYLLIHCVIYWEVGTCSLLTFLLKTQQKGERDSLSKESAWASVMASCHFLLLLFFGRWFSITVKLARLMTPRKVRLPVSSKILKGAAVPAPQWASEGLLIWGPRDCGLSCFPIFSIQWVGHAQCCYKVCFQEKLKSFVSSNFFGLIGFLKTLSFLMHEDQDRVWWCTPVISSTQETEAGGS